MGTIHSVYTASLTLCVLFLVGVIFRVNSFSKRRSYRPEVIPPGTERVLILGASAGIGRTLAHRYAERGAKVCVVARKSAELEVVRSECEVRARAPDSALNICADITRAEDLVTIREAISESAFSAPNTSPQYLTRFYAYAEWHGLDTLIVAAGVSALRPVLEIAGVEGPSITQPDLDGIRRVEDVALAAIKGNYLGPLLSVVTMVGLRSC
jgi:NAD(P)-dependent dehydrogenase (short-subunit alcohol dehydrogenase family)